MLINNLPETETCRDCRSLVKHANDATMPRGCHDETSCQFIIHVIFNQITFYTYVVPHNKIMLK